MFSSLRIRSNSKSIERGRGEVPREAHNLQTPVRFRAPQPVRKKSDFMSGFFLGVIIKKEKPTQKKSGLFF